jgi:hypothetical protein
MQYPTPRHTFTTPHLMPFNVTPIQQLTILEPPPFNAGGFNHGCRGQSTGGRGHRQGFNWQGCGCTPFSDHMAAHCIGFQGGSSAHNMFPQVGGFQTVHAQHMNPQYSKVTKKYNNWNVCYSWDSTLKTSIRIWLALPIGASPHMSKAS